MDQECQRVLGYVRAIEELCRDDRRRREWLWLRAREKEDEPAVEALERADPGLRIRMSRYDRRAAAFRDGRERREAYGRMLDELTPDPELIPCDCPRCRPAPGSEARVDAPEQRVAAIETRLPER